MYKLNNTWSETNDLGVLDYYFNSYSINDVFKDEVKIVPFFL